MLISEKLFPNFRMSVIFVSLIIQKYKKQRNQGLNYQELDVRKFVTSEASRFGLGNQLAVGSRQSLVFSLPNFLTLNLR